MAEINNVIAEASQDLQTIEDFVNLPADSEVYPRLLPSVNVGTLAGTRDAIFRAGGLPAEPFETKAQMISEGASLPDGKHAMVTDDTVNNGLYVKTAGAWVKSGYDPILQANAYADDNKLDLQDITYEYDGGSVLGDKVPRYTNFGVSSSYIPVKSSRYDSIVLEVTAGEVLYIFNDKGSYVGQDVSKPVFFAEDPYLNLSQARVEYSEYDTVKTDSDSSITYLIMTVPTNAKYMIVNTRFTPSSGAVRNWEWAVHRGEFRPTYEIGEVVISKIKETIISPTFKSNSAKEFADEIEEKVLTSAKSYADDNKLDFADLSYSYVGGSFISDETPEYMGFGLDGGLNPTTAQWYDSYVLKVNPGDMLAIRNDQNTYKGSTGGGVSFFAEDPFINQSQEGAVTGFAENLEGGTRYLKGIVPDGMNYLVMNTRKSISSGEVTYFKWSVHKNKFIDSYDTGEKVITGINDVAISGSNSNADSGGNFSGVDHPVVVRSFIDLDTVRDPKMSSLKEIEKGISGSGILYSVRGDTETDSESNNLFAQVSNVPKGVKKLNINVANFTSKGDRAVGKLKLTPFNVPSAIITEPNSFPNASKYPDSLVVHPSIAYSPTAIGGFKYWMVASSYPPANSGDALWEDEEVYVSNNAKDWQRVRSMYETNKEYTTSTLRLPPQLLVTKNSRKHGFMPSPSLGDTFEMSMPAVGSYPAVDREMMTIVDRLPYKHDPFIFIEDGYIYTYHTFHVPVAGREDRTNKFMVCVGTSNGVDWDVVRTDGSKMRLTEESSKTIFTKDSLGRYNYIKYQPNGVNPEIIKYGDGDYELLYGTNFTSRYKGSTPYDFDWDTPHSMQSIASDHHPASLLHDGVLYIINQLGVYSSTNRGETLTKLPKYPLWVGGLDGFSYKRCLCIGEGGKLILGDVQRPKIPNAGFVNDGQFSKMNDANKLFLQEYASADEFVSLAQSGLKDAYVDISIAKINFETNERDFYYCLALSSTSNVVTGNSPIQSLHFLDIDFKEGDELFIYATVNSRNGNLIWFGGLDIR